ncbi:MAG: hypothetical protein R3C59_09935 [Planctomycetaceae bacterium]
MIQPQPFKLDLSTVQVAARLWVAGQGCRYFHSENLSDQECHALLDELAASQSPPNDDAKEADFGAVPGRKRAFFVLQRVPDPNNSHRKVTNSWFFLDKAGRLTLPMLEAFAKNPIFADTQAEFVDRLQTTDFTPNFISPPPDDRSLARDPASVASTTSQWSLKPKRFSIVAIILIASVIMLLVLTRRNAVDSDPDPITPVVEPQTFDSRWTSETLKTQMREAIGKGKPIDMEDEQLLQEFVNLFTFDAKSLNLNPSQTEDMQRQCTSDLPNPFAKFLLELPTPKGGSVGDSNEAMPRQFRNQIMQLADTIEIGADQDGDQVDLSSLNPEEIVRALRNRLDYRVYYEKWHNEFQPNQKQDPWLEQWRVDGDKSWIPEARKFIRENY